MDSSPGDISLTCAEARSAASALQQEFSLNRLAVAANDAGGVNAETPRVGCAPVAVRGSQPGLCLRTRCEKGGVLAVLMTVGTYGR